MPRSFDSVERAGLDRSLLPMRLWEKSKELGTWNPSDIDFSRDRQDWKSFDENERDVLLRLTSLFLGGEEAVTDDLTPLIQVVAAEGRLEEEIFLASFLFEEAKHVDVFCRFLDEVPDEPGDLTRFHGDHYRAIFADALPEALGNLRDDNSPAAQARASATYNMIVEGVLAETGYYAYEEALVTHDVMPGMQRVTGLLQKDESRHLAYGVYLLSRLVASHGDDVWEVVDETMDELLPHALGMIDDVFSAYDEMPLGLDLDDFRNYATTQFQQRRERLEAARDAAPADIRAM